MSKVLPPLPGPSRGLKIGLFGGSFNPAHSGHMHVAETALKRCQLDWVWWLVARGNPLKSDHGDYAKRLASAETVASKNPRMFVSDIEAQLKQNYTRLTLKALTARAPDAHFVWIMGSDSLAGFHRWKDWQGIAETIPIVSVARPGFMAKAKVSRFAKTFSSARIPEKDAAILPLLKTPAWTHLTAPLNPTSSTALRRKT